MNYQRVIVGGYEMLMGDPGSDLEKIPFLGLEIGDKVNQIGRKTKSGRISSSCRIHQVTPYMTYSGLFRFKDDLYMAFKLPPDGVTGNDGIPVTDDFYGLFCTNIVEGEEPELLAVDHTRGSLLIFKAVFQVLEVCPFCGYSYVVKSIKIKRCINCSKGWQFATGE